MAQPMTFEATVQQVARHGSDVASYRLRANKRLPRFAPGQFIHLTMDRYDPSTFWPESRVFSVANAVADRQTIDLTISRQGQYTRRILDNLALNDTVWCKGPYGEFRVEPDPAYPHAVLVAGGTGVTPFAAFLDAALAAGELPLPRVTLYYGARSSELLIYLALVSRCTNELRGFAAHCFAESGPCAQGVAPGSLDIDRIVAATPAIEQARFYLSGPHAMIKHFQHVLTEKHGVPAAQVMIDAWQ